MHGECSQCAQVTELYLDVCFECYTKQTGKEPPMKLENDAPVFESFEAMTEYLEKMNKVEKAKTKTSSKSKKKGHSPMDITAPEVADASIFQTVHFYVRANDTVESVQKDAREERKIRNDNVLVFVHGHSYGEDCVSKCKEQV